MLRVVLLPTIVLAATSSCKGIIVSDDCWVLSQPAQSCADLCGGASRVDAETTVGGATTRMVVSALEAKYGLHDTSKDSLDAPCGWPPYLAEGEVQFPEWGMVSLPPHTAHRTRHTCPAHIRAEVHRATPGSTCSSPTRTSMARAVGTASKVRPTAESRPACAALVSATRRLQAHHRPHHRTRRRRHRLLLRGSLLGRRRLRLRCGYRSRLPRLALASCKLAKPACPDADKIDTIQIHTTQYTLRNDKDTHCSTEAGSTGQSKRAPGRGLVWAEPVGALGEAGLRYVL